MERIQPMNELQIQEKVEDLAGKSARILDCEQNTMSQMEEVLLVNGIPISLSGEEGAKIKEALILGEVPPCDLVNNMLIRAGIETNPVELETTVNVKSSVKTLEHSTLVDSNGVLVDEKMKEKEDEDEFRKVNVEIWSTEEVNNASLETEDPQKRLDESGSNKNNNSHHHHQKKNSGGGSQSGASGQGGKKEKGGKDGGGRASDDKSTTNGHSHNKTLKSLFSPGSIIKSGGHKSDKHAKGNQNNKKSQSQNDVIPKAGSPAPMSPLGGSEKKSVFVATPENNPPLSSNNPINPHQSTTTTTTTTTTTPTVPKNKFLSLFSKGSKSKDKSNNSSGGKLGGDDGGKGKDKKSDKQSPPESTNNKSKKNHSKNNKNSITTPNSGEKGSEKIIMGSSPPSNTHNTQHTPKSPTAQIETKKQSVNVNYLDPAKSLVHVEIDGIPVRVTYETFV